MTVEANSGQIEYWNSAAGEKWAVNQERLDRQLSLVADRLFERSAIQPGERIIDIGCGTGASALRAAQAVGPNGHVFGVDISQPMLDLAKSRAGGMDNLRLEIADAQNHDFVPGARDLLQSRFGVMFFADPIAAFANLLTALRPGGRLSFVCWAAMADNPWFMIPRNAAARHLGEPEPWPPRAPGPTAFAEADYVTGILKSAGFGDVRVDTEACDLIGGDSAANTAAFAVNVGPAARILKLHSPSPETIAAITADVEAEMVPYLRTEGVRVPAKLNFVSAERP
ncbi:MAG: methyltransferase domain-containing protein [Rhodospirillaceae bacterium]|nr:methyltransferase domain-containing protein [Rhodospirillaceae bacterium]